MSARTDSWLPLYIADYRADTMRFTTEQHGAYLLIIMDYWRNGPPPDDDEVLAQITGLPLARWKKHRPVLAAKFQIENGVWKHKRIEAELARAKGKQQALSERGKQGADARWNKDDSGNGSGSSSGNGPSMPQALPESLPNTMPADAPSPSHTQEVLPAPAPPPSPPQAPKSVSRKRDPDRKTGLPIDFSVSDRVQRWANGKGYDRIDDHLEAFISKVKQHGYRNVDWDEAFMGAIREDWARLRNGGGKQREGTPQAAVSEAERRIFGNTEKDITGEAERL